MTGRRRPCTLWDQAIRKDLRVRLTGGNCVAQFLRQQGGDIRPAYAAGKGVCLGGRVKKISRTLGNSRHRDLASRNALCHPSPLIVAKEEDLVALDGAAKRP